jgi:hypothetical protein
MRRQSGQGKIGCVLWILAFSICALAAYKMVPIKIKSAELHDFMVDQAKWTARRTAEQVAKAVLQKAQELELPVTEDDVRVVIERERIKMDVSYTVPVEFPGYTYYWKFNHNVDRPIFII